ncbi:MAG: guanylate kinase [Candidatus Riflebacteria bacterium HGW-Riflebacteria-1]|jgi:guanylate kinase|nr:MAG: guanylate kinase [Candidatus Riflebacteria bacterium HGW-Riflebacteria-1]
MNAPATTRKGYLFIVSGPSGVGKTVLCNAIVSKFAPDVVYSISTTSRAPRGGETNGQEYFFCTAEEFEKDIGRNEFAEWAFVHGNYYGTPRRFVTDNLDAGKHVILNIDVQGAMKIREAYPESIMIFILPPTFDALESRIRKRNMDSEHSLRHRLENARKELDYREHYKYTVINDNLDAAINELTDIFTGYVQRRQVEQPALAK